MKALIAVLLFSLVACAANPPKTPPPEPEPKIIPIAAVFWETCGILRGATVTFSNGRTLIFEREEIEESPALAAELEALPKIKVHLEGVDVCTCST